MTKHKERGIIFNSEMVRAILEGRKSQTRMVVKNPEYFGCLTGDCPHDRQKECDKAMSELCPHRKPGDHLWLKETFAYVSKGSTDPGITLEITDVRVERLQTISSEDANLEGVKPRPRDRDCYPNDDYVYPFQRLWDSSSKPEHSWEANPWCWVIEFKVVK